MKPEKAPQLDAYKQREICAIIAVGGSQKVAAHYVGCTVLALQAAAAADKDFKQQLKKAQSRHEISSLKDIQSAAKKPQYWRAAAWVLERRYPQRYAARLPDTITFEQIVPVLSQLGDIVAIEVSNPVDRQRILAKVRRLTAKLGKPQPKRKPAKRKTTTAARKLLTDERRKPARGSET